MSNEILRHDDKELCPICILHFTHKELYVDCTKYGHTSLNDNGERVMCHSGELLSDLKAAQASKDQKDADYHYEKHKEHIDDRYEEWRGLFLEGLLKKRRRTMNDEEIELYAKTAYDELMETGSGVERKLEGDKTYKPFYRTVAILTAINGWDCPDKALTKNEMRQVMERMHPWFDEMLKTKEGQAEFDWMYPDFFDIWHNN